MSCNEQRTVNFDGSSSGFCVCVGSLAVLAGEAAGFYVEAGMSKKDEALKLALKALEAIGNGTEFWDVYPSDHPYGLAKTAITALREALAEQPAQRTWVGLTNVEIASACKKNGGSEWWWKDIEEFARAIEAKLKEKNT